MISTVTTTTVTTVTSVQGAAGALGALATLLLFAILVGRELASSDERPRLQLLSRALNIAVVPLTMVVGALIVSRVVAQL